jgi:hypothetical protein
MNDVAHNLEHEMIVKALEDSYECMVSLTEEVKDLKERNERLEERVRQLERNATRTRGPRLSGGRDESY